LYVVIMLAPANVGLASIPSEDERSAVKKALETLKERPEKPEPYRYKRRKDGWEMHVGRWKITYELRQIELVVYVHNIKERPSLGFDYRY